MRRLAWVALAVAGLGCNQDPRGSDDAGATLDGGASMDGGADSPFVTEQFQVPARTEVDLLLVVDDSGSMCEEQNHLTQALRGLPQVLAEADLRAAVITTDMQDPARQGRFQTTYAEVGGLNCLEDPDVAGCPATLSPVLSAADAGECGDDRACRLQAMGTRLGCMAQQGTSGDGFESGLAALKAATACDGPNAEHFAPCCVDGRYDPACAAKPAFLRPEAVLVVLIVSDEDDCSADPDMPVSRANNSVCEWDRDQLVPVQAFRDHLVTLKARPDEQLVVVPIVGPPDLDAQGNVVRYRPATGADAPCLDPAGNYDPSQDPDGACCEGGVCPGSLQTSCESDLGAAFAGHRYLALAEALGQPVQAPEANICTLAGWADRITQPVAVVDGAYCLERAPACRRAVNFVSGDIGRACSPEEAQQPVGRSVAVSVNGRALGPDAYRVEATAGCPSGFQLILAERPPAEAAVIVRYVLEAG